MQKILYTTLCKKNKYSVDKYFYVYVEKNISSRDPNTRKLRIE